MTTPRNQSSAGSRPPDVVPAAALRRTRLVDRFEVVRHPAVVGIDGGQDLQIARPPVDRDHAEPELPLWTVLEEIAPAGEVVLAQARMPDREPGGLPSLTRGLPRRRRREGQHHPEHEGDRPPQHIFLLLSDSSNRPLT